MPEIPSWMNVQKDQQPQQPASRSRQTPPLRLAQSSKYEFLYPGAFTMLRVNLNAGETMKAESDAMVAMSLTIDVEGKLEGGVLGGFGRMLSGEKFFFQQLAARRGPGQVLLSPSMPAVFAAPEES